MKKNLKQAIHVKKSAIPDQQEYLACVTDILTNGQLTNGGKYLLRLEKALQKFFESPYMLACANGTLALQLALRAANLSGKKVITTPFSYVATVSALLWEGCTPVFADIDPETLCLSPRELERVYTKDLAGILPVHVYGNACNIKLIDEFAQQKGLQVVYDAAHTFGCTLNGKALASYGDFATLSFHATKIFQTAEGGAIVCQSQEALERLGLLRAFGHRGDTHISLGINAKMSELHAALGCCGMGNISANLQRLKSISASYDQFFKTAPVQMPKLHPGLGHNYSYYPVIFESEDVLLRVMAALNEANIYPRRYFYPALNTLPYLSTYQPCPVAEDISLRVLCLPHYPELDDAAIEQIADLIIRHV